MNNTAFFKLSYGVYVLTSYDAAHERYTGCTINSAVQITSSPATLAVSVNRGNYTNECIKHSGTFAVNVLTQAADASLIGNFGFSCGKDRDKFANVPYVQRGGAAVLPDACSYIVCNVTDMMETATHTIFLGEAIDCDVLSSAAPMTYAYYHDVVKGKTPPKAPTYVAQDAAPSDDGRQRYKCSVCGYVYDGKTPFEDLPDDYVCPICGQPKSKFAAF